MESKLSITELRRLSRIRRAALRRQHKECSCDEPLVYGLWEWYRRTKDIRGTLRLLFSTKIYERLDSSFLAQYEGCGDGQIPFLDEAFRKAPTPAHQIELFRFLFLELASVIEDNDIRKDAMYVGIRMLGSISFRDKGSVEHAAQLEVYKELMELQTVSLDELWKSCPKALEKLGVYMAMPEASLI